MFQNKLIIAFLIGLTLIFTLTANAQSNPAAPLFPNADDKFDPSGGVREMLRKLEIQKERKDFEEMQDRAKQAFELSKELEDSVTGNARLTEKERSKLDELEKLVKRIRNDLGGSDDDETKFDEDGGGQKPDSFADAVKALQSVTGKMYEEIQKTTRFTVSGAVIRASNAVLRLTRLVRVFK